MTIRSLFLWVNCEIVDWARSRVTQNISCVGREAEPENTTWICSYHFPPELTDPGTGVAAEGLWASLAGQSLCQWVHHGGKGQSRPCRENDSSYFGLPSIPSPKHPEVKYCSFHGNMRAGEADPSYRWQNWGSERSGVGGLHCVPALRSVIPFDRRVP